MEPRPSNELILILGGARSGKSAYAEDLVARIAGERPVLYVATATTDDDEMRARVAAHRASRPTHWRTVEAPLAPAAAIRDALTGTGTAAILLDCVTLLVSNILLESGDTEAEARVIRTLSDLVTLQRETQVPLLLVSNEVGMGVVPPYPLGRLYRDVLGRANALLAREASTVLLLIAGLPVELKALSAAWRREASRRYGAHDP